ncbi:MAG TPA: hypothetical protein VMW69_16140 [Spirochaetia bacterium]|nr:hypothetical protein [Spirochaetia bacterium]
MNKLAKPILLIAIFSLALAACSLGSSAYLSQSYDTTFTKPVSKPLDVPPTATTVTLTGTASVDRTNTLFIFVNAPDGSVNPESITGDGTGATKTIKGSWPAQAGTWTLRVSATGATGSFDLTLQYQ